MYSPLYFPTLATSANCRGDCSPLSNTSNLQEREDVDFINDCLIIAQFFPGREVNEVYHNKSNTL